MSRPANKATFCSVGDKNQTILNTDKKAAPLITREAAFHSGGERGIQLLELLAF